MADVEMIRALWALSKHINVITLGLNKCKTNPTEVKYVTDWVQSSKITQASDSPQEISDAFENFRTVFDKYP